MFLISYDFNHILINGFVTGSVTSPLPGTCSRAILTVLYVHARKEPKMPKMAIL